MYKKNQLTGSKLIYNKEKLLWHLIEFRVHEVSFASSRQ